MWNVKAEVIPVIIGANVKHLKITQTVPQQHTGKARNKGTKENSHIGHCLRTLGSTNVKSTISLSWDVLVTVHVQCIVTTEQLQHYVPQEHGFVSGI